MRRQRAEHQHAVHGKVCVEPGYLGEQRALHDVLRQGDEPGVYAQLGAAPDRRLFIGHVVRPLTHTQDRQRRLNAAQTQLVHGFGGAHIQRIGHRSALENLSHQLNLPDTSLYIS